MLTTAHLGLVALYFGDLEKAASAGKLLQKFSALQPDVTQGFYLRMSDAGNIITDFPQEAGVFFQVNAVQPNQAYFMIGYPIAFLGKLYQATQDAQYIATAKEYLNFASTCQNHLYTCHFSHKVAWGAAILANLTGEHRFADLAIRIADYLLSIQGANGAWLQEQPAHTAFDQTAEIAIWLQEIAAELAHQQRKKSSFSVSLQHDPPRPSIIRSLDGALAESGLQGYCTLSSEFRCASFRLQIAFSRKLPWSTVIGILMDP